MQTIKAFVKTNDLEYVRYITANNFHHNYNELDNFWIFKLENNQIFCVSQQELPNLIKNNYIDCSCKNLLDQNEAVELFLTLVELLMEDSIKDYIEYLEFKNLKLQKYLQCQTHPKDIQISTNYDIQLNSNIINTLKEYLKII